MSDELYCPECDDHRTSPYCPDCGTETKERTPESIDWPIEFEYTVGHGGGERMGHEIRQQLAASETLPEDFPENYYYEFYPEATYNVKIFEDHDIEIQRVRHMTCKNPEHSHAPRMEMEVEEVESTVGSKERVYWVCPKCGARVRVRS